MKKRIFSLALALVMTLALAAPVFAEGEEAPAPEYRLASATGTYGETYTFTYGQGGWLPTEVDRFITAAYDDAGRVVSLENTLAGSDIRDTYEYDEDGNLLASSSHQGEVYIDENTSLPARDYSVVYTYDDSGNRIGEEQTSVRGDEAPDVTAYEYVYTYDEAGALQSRETYSDGQLSSENVYSYDEAGNLLRQEIIRNGETTELTYDAQGNMLSETYYHENGEVSYESKYTYDEDGREIQWEYTSYGADNTYTITDKYVYTPLLVFDLSEGPSGQTVRYRLLDSEGVNVLGSWYAYEYTAEPQFTYDDNGYVTKIDLGSGTLTFTYEPVA